MSHKTNLTHCATALLGLFCSYVCKVSALHHFRGGGMAGMAGMKSNNAISSRSVCATQRTSLHPVSTDIHDKGPKKERMALSF